MPEPKRLRIMKAVADRVATIGDPVFSDRREPQANELPCMVVFTAERSSEETRNYRARCEMLINVMGYRVLENGDAETIGNEILSAIASAVELEDRTLGGLLRHQDGLEFISDEIYLPDVGENVVGARVTYSAPHVRVYGDPEIT